MCFYRVLPQIKYIYIYICFTNVLSRILLKILASSLRFQSVYEEDLDTILNG